MVKPRFCRCRPAGDRSRSPHRSPTPSSQGLNRFPWRGPAGRLAQGAIAAATTALVLLSPRIGMAAETLTLSLGSLSFDIPLADLETFAETGELPRSLRFYQEAGRTAQLNAVQSILGQPLPVSSTMVSQFLALPEGKELLTRLGYLVKPSSRQVDGAAMLQQTLIAASVDGAGLSLLNLIRQFPEPTLELDLSLAIALVEENAQFYSRRSDIIQAIWQQANLSLGSGTSPSPLTSTPSALDRPGPYRWRLQSFAFRNPDRPSFSKGDLYLPERSLGAANARPSAAAANAASNQTPVVVISHGLGSNRRTFAYLAEHLASHGYGVIALEHSETSSDRFNQFLNGLADPPSPSELTNRPGDISAALDDLTQRAQGNPALAQLNLDSVGVLGQSLGGYTALAAAGAEINRPLLQRRCARDPQERRLSLNISTPIQCRILELPQNASLAVADPRVGAAIAVNPVTSQIFGQAGLAKLQRPVMIVASTDDYVAPSLPEQVEPFGWIGSRDKYLLLAENATHFSFLGNDGSASVIPLPETLFGPEGSNARRALSAVSLAFFNRHLLDQSRYGDYLNQGYVSGLAGQPFRYAIVEQLPRSMPALLGRP